MKIIKEKCNSESRIDNLIGFSDKINDPVIKEFIYRHKRKIINFSLAAIFLFPLAFLIYSFFVKELLLFEAIINGIIVGIIQFIFISIWTQRNFSKKSWDGIVSNKQMIKKNKKYYDKNKEYCEEYLEYTLEFSGDNNEKHGIKIIDDDVLFNYFI